MENNITEKVKQSIQNLKDKKSKIYLLVQDTKGNAIASVRFIYQIGLTLKTNGFNPIILHEKNDYSGVANWLGEEYMEIPHKSIENQNLEISPEDFIILPELYGYIMEQIKNLPCGKIVLSQSHSNILETLQPGQNWAQFGFLKCITTSNVQKEYLEKIMKQTTFDIIEPMISENFTPRSLPPMPIIAVHTREHRDTVNLIKTFYLKFPQYRWFTFKDMRGLSEKEFAETLKECFLSVWIDDDSSFGTFPLESMSCNVPVLGKLPNLQHSWMTENNGIWVTDKTLIPDFVADFIQNWLEDNIKPELYEESQKTVSTLKNKQSFDLNVVNLFEDYLKTRSESFESQLSKTKN
jgi:hypothetical protein